MNPIRTTKFNNIRCPMTTRIILLSTITVTMLVFSGCNESRTSDYPDNSVNTTRRVDDIKRNARDQKDEVDAEADRLSNRMDFEERQIREKYKAERQVIINTSEKQSTERDAKTRELQIQAKHDKDMIDAETAEKLKTSPVEKAAEIQADANSRKLEIDSRTTKNLAPSSNESEREKTKDIQRGLEIDRNESRDISALEQERSKMRNEMKVKKLKIDTWTNEELDKISKEEHPNGKESGSVPR